MGERVSLKVVKIGSHVGMPTGGVNFQVLFWQPYNDNTRWHSNLRGEISESLDEKL